MRYGKYFAENIFEVLDTPGRHKISISPMSKDGRQVLISNISLNLFGGNNLVQVN